MSTDLDRRLSRVSLGGNGGLLNEDISLAMDGDDSFGYGEAGAGDEEEETVRLDAGRPGAGPASRAGEEQVFFGGSMAPTAPTKAGTARMAPPVPATPMNSRHAPPDAYSAGDEEDDEFESALLSILASAPAPAPSSSSADAAQTDIEQPKKQEGPYSEEEVAEIRRLKEERDGLRGMNAVLGDLLGSLRGMEGKMQVRREELLPGGRSWTLISLLFGRTSDRLSRPRTPCSTCTLGSRVRRSTRRTCCWTASGAA